MKKSLSAIVIISFIAFSCGMIPKKASKNGVRIEYSKEVSQEDVDKLLNFLAENNNDGSTKDFKLSKEGDGFRIKMVVQSGFDSDEKNVELMTDFACEISKDVYGGKMINLDLCDEYWKLKKSVMSENCDQFEMNDKKSQMFGNVELFYGEVITEKERKDVGDYLTDYFGTEKERTFVIDKKNGKGILSIVVTNKKYYEDEELLEVYRIIACDLTKVLGYSTEVHMCDEYMKKQKVVEASKCD